MGRTNLLAFLRDRQPPSCFFLDTVFLQPNFVPSTWRSYTYEIDGRGLIVGSLSNDDGDGNENSKKAIGSDWQNNNFARARVIVHFSAVVARLRLESAKFQFHVL